MNQGQQKLIDLPNGAWIEAVTLVDSTGSTTNGANVTVAALSYPLSTGNNSSAQLTAGSTFTGTIETILNLQAAQIEIVCDQPYTLTINQFIDVAGTKQSGSITYYKAAGVPTNINVSLPGNYFQITVKNTGASTTTTLNINTTFGIMDSVDDKGNHPVSERSITGAVAMTVGTSYAEARQLFINCTAAGNVALTFTDSTVLVVPVLAGLTILPWAVTAINTSGTTATATYANLK